MQKKEQKNSIVQKHTIWTIPNLLSIIRMLMVPFIVWQYVVGCYWTALILLVISGLTDVADGIIARSFHLISDLGKFLDPIADKLTQASVVVCVSLNHPEFLLMVIILVAKELAMLLGATQLVKLGKRPSESKWWGKLSTVMLYCIVGLLFLYDALAIQGYEQYLTVLMVIGCIFIVFALFQYYPVFKAILSGKYDVETERYTDSLAALNYQGSEVKEKTKAPEENQ